MNHSLTYPEAVQILNEKGFVLKYGNEKGAVFMKGHNEVAILVPESLYLLDRSFSNHKYKFTMYSLNQTK